MSIDINETPRTRLGSLVRRLRTWYILLNRKPPRPPTRRSILWGVRLRRLIPRSTRRRIVLVCYCGADTYQQVKTYAIQSWPGAEIREEERSAKRIIKLVVTQVHTAPWGFKPEVLHWHAPVVRTNPTDIPQA